MKKKLTLILAMLLAGSLFAEQKVPDYQVSITTNGLALITLSTNRLDTLVNWLDSNIVLQTNLATRTTTNWVNYAITNIWAPYWTTNPVGMPTNRAARFLGDTYILAYTNVPSTQVVYKAMWMGNTNWTAIYRGQ